MYKVLCIFKVHYLRCHIHAVISGHGNVKCVERNQHVTRRQKIVP